MSDPTVIKPESPNNSPEISGSHGNHGNPEYIAFVLVPVFFLLGLLGVLICHILKKKGYRCTTEAEEEEEEEEQVKLDVELGTEMNDYSDSNNDTVGQIINFIMLNEANSDALKAMIRENSIDSDGPSTTPTSPVSPTSPATPLTPAPAGTAKHTCSHLHTIGVMAGQKNVCHRCNQKKWPLVHRPSAKRTHSGVTVLSVGRFRVTKSELKPIKNRRNIMSSNGSVFLSPTETELKSRTTSESKDQTDTPK